MASGLRCTGRSCLLMLLLLPGLAAAAPASIVVDPDLLANAEVLKVDLGTRRLLHTWDFRFGEYSVVSSKAHPEVTETTREFLDPVGQQRTRRKYSFVMQGADATVARVKAVQNVTAADIPDLDLGAGVGIDVESMVGEADDLAASIVIDGDQPETWLLLLNVRRRLAGTAVETRLSVLGGAGREIAITAVSSDRPGAKPALLPARGYEFAEAGRAIAALQYLSGGPLGYNRNLVYLRRDLDSRTKLLLAAAASAIMEALGPH